MQDDLCSEACRLIQQLMESYVSGDPEQMAAMLSHVSADVVVIGTGKHEFYQDLEALLKGLEKDQEEARDIEFIIQNEWFSAKLINEGACVVYGEFEAHEADAQGKQFVIQMDTRVTSIVHREPSGRLVIDSLHHSVPYLYQEEGEYYPKTFASELEKALEHSAALERAIQLDPMTRLYNRKYTEQHIKRLLDQEKASGFLFLLDLDGFKRVNDLHGHQMGDALLKRFAAMLAQFAGPEDIAGRIGGDEFMLFLPGPTCREVGAGRASQIINETRKIFGEMHFRQGCSIGIATVIGGGLTFDEAYRRADEALYRAKAAGKSAYCWERDA